jgi:hypothetical protein
MTRPDVPVHEQLRAAQATVDELARQVARLERMLGGGPLEPELRRLRSDTGHLRESLGLLSAAVVPRQRTPADRPVDVPEAPYDPRLWAGTDDEGLGAGYRRGTG